MTIFDAVAQQLQRDVLAEPLGAFHDTIGPEFAPAFYHLKSAVLLRILLGEDAPLEARHDWLAGRIVDEAIRTAFDAALAALDEEHDGPPSTWRGPAVMTAYGAVGLGSAEPHPFMNRGTYNRLAVVDTDPGDALARRHGHGPAARRSGPGVVARPSG